MFSACGTFVSVSSRTPGAVPASSSRKNLTTACVCGKWMQDVPICFQTIGDRVQPDDPRPLLDVLQQHLRQFAQDLGFVKVQVDLVGAEGGPHMPRPRLV
jgi:hypothetical protein